MSKAPCAAASLVGKLCANHAHGAPITEACHDDENAAHDAADQRRGALEITDEQLASIKILFCAPDTLTLYGIPYEMQRDVGQEPGHLWRASRDYVPPPRTVNGCVVVYGGRTIDPIAGWIYLGEPGWCYNMSRKSVTRVQLWLAAQGDNVPGNPYEWTRIDEPRPANPTAPLTATERATAAAIVEHGLGGERPRVTASEARRLAGRFRGGN